MKNFSMIALALVLMVSSFGFADPTFTGDALKIKTQMEQLFDASKKVNDATAKGDARGKIESAMDWDRVAQDCLGKAGWKKATPANRDAFKKTLKEVVVKTAYSRMDTFWDNTKYTFDAIDVKGNEAVVKAKFQVKEDPFLLEYFLNKKGNTWLVYDISYEEIRYSVNINEQVTAFLKEQPFSALLDKLRKRRDELDKGKAPSNDLKKG